jgi:Subtilase family
VTASWNFVYPWSQGLDGCGVSVGIVSNSFDAANDWTLIPPNTTILQDGMGDDEGRAMAQLVRDVAPNANVVFCEGDSEADGALAIQREVAAGCKVIVIDEEYPGSNADITAAIDQATARGVLVMSSAGNGGVAGGSDYTLDPNSNPIGAVDINHLNTVEPYSSISTNLRFVAPDAIPTSVPGLNPFRGTSAAVVSAGGLAALIVQAVPNITPANAIAAIQESAGPAFSAPVQASYGAGQSGAGLPNPPVAIGVAMIDPTFTPPTGAQVYASNEAGHRTWSF